MAILLSRKFLISTFFVAIVYVFLTIYLMNLTLVRSTLFGTSPLLYKIKLLSALLGGMWTAMSTTSLVVLFVVGVLTGANLSMLVMKVRLLGGLKSTHLVIGGGSLLGIAGSGCAVCGLPIISLLGLSTSVAFLPLHGTELSYIAIALLLLSFFILMRGYRTEFNRCKIKEKGKNIVNPKD